MNLNFLQKLGGPVVQRAALKLSKYAPEILTGVGIAGVVVSTVMIAKAAPKLAPVMADFQDRRQDLVFRKEDAEYTTYSKDLTLTYARQGVEVAKILGPGISISAGSLFAILAAHGIMRRRAVALMGAYQALQSTYQAYRERVIAEYGENVDRDFRLGFHNETITDPETGKKTKVRRIDPTHPSQYAKFFDELNDNYKPDPEYNLLFLKNQQQWANDKLQLRGYLFLNDVYDMLGLPKTRQGQIVGWVMDPDNGGDLHIDFNIYNADSEKARDFVNGLERAILLDFNVDGVILDLIDKFVSKY